MLTLPKYYCEMTSREIQKLNNWGEKLWQKASEHLTYGEALVLTKTHAEMSTGYRQKIKDAPFFWGIFSVGIELLIKSALVTHGLLRLQRRAMRPPGNFGGVPATLDSHVQGAYDAARATKVKSDDAFVQHELDARNIAALWDINTPTLGSLATNRGVHLLQQAGLLTAQSAELMSQRLHCLAYIRRNVESHIYLGRTVVEQGHDFSEVYVPLIRSILPLVT